MKHPAILWILLSCSLTAQTTWIVGYGGQFPELQTAIYSPLVRPGDTLQLVNGPYPHEGFTLTKGITIRGPMTIAGSFSFRSGYYTTINVPPGELACLVDLTFVTAQVIGGGSAGAVAVTGGAVWFEGCAMTAQQIRAGLTVGSAAVTLANCTLTAGGGGTGLAITGGTVAAHGTAIFGGPDTCVGRNGCQGPTGPGPGVAMQGGTLHGSLLQVRGGSNSSWNWIPTADGIRADAASRLWLADSTVTGGAHTLGLAGGIGIVNLATTPVRLARSTVNGGSGTPPGAATQGPIDASTPLLGIAAPGALQRGSAYQATAFGTIATPIVWLFSSELSPQQVAVVEEPLWFLATQAWFVIDAGVVGSQGSLAFQLSLPQDPSLANARGWIHAVGGALATPFQAAPPIGGLIR